MSTQGDKPVIVVYTDGACIGNPGPGGIGIVVMGSTRTHEASAGYRRTTNNRMELLAAIRALRAIRKPASVTVYSDSQYVVLGVNDGRVYRWERNGWKASNGKRTANVDLWEQLLPLLRFHEVEFVWVQGHIGNPHNEQADALALAAARSENLLIDEGYERDGGNEGHGRQLW